MAFWVLPLSAPAAAANAEKATLETVTQQFQQATAAVIASARDFFAKMNAVEQNGSLDELAFERKPINKEAIDQIQIVSPQELKVRTDALDALSKYTTDLASLAGGASLKTFGQNLQGLSKNLKQTATDAASLPGVPKASFLKNKEFPGLIGEAVTAIGGLAALIEGRKAQNEIKAQILANDKTLTAISEAIGEEIGLAYERQRNKDSARERNLTIEYNNSLTGSDVFLSLLLVQQVEASRAQMAALANANPAKAVAAMQKAHSAMVQYVASGKRMADLESLVVAVGGFSSAAQSSQPASAAAK
jgi:hypothetical protein